jgi:protein-L-isoaspartate(D-aspartate) O-methyltransferase
MTLTVDTSADSDRVAGIRDALTDKLRSDGMITSLAVERAFRMVPRHLFVPEGIPLEVAYNADDSVTIKTDKDGVIISSISAPFIQARMIEQAGLGPGMSVLEIGSGGPTRRCCRGRGSRRACGQRGHRPGGDQSSSCCAGGDRVR